MLALISFFFLVLAQIRIISGSTGPIFAVFSLNDRYWIVDDRSGSLFPKLAK